jgi:hypothetical protein
MGERARRRGEKFRGNSGVFPHRLAPTIIVMGLGFLWRKHV